MTEVHAFVNQHYIDDLMPDERLVLDVMAAGALRWIVQAERDPDGFTLAQASTQKMCIRWAAASLRLRWLWKRRLGQLRIKNREGRIVSERTYGGDSRKVPG